jgi:hypothetical protein
MPSAHSHMWRTAICAASLIPRGRERARRERARRQQRDHDDCREHSKPEVTGIAGSTNVPATGIGARHDRHPTAHSQKRHRWDTAGTRHGAASQRKAASHSQPAERTRRGVTRQVAPSGRTGAARRQHGRPAPRASGRREHAPAVKRSPRSRLRSGFRTKDRSHACARSGHSGTKADAETPENRRRARASALSGGGRQLPASGWSRTNARAPAAVTARPLDGAGRATGAEVQAER